MATVPTKTVQSNLLDWTDVNSATETIGTAFNTATKWSGGIGIRLGRKSGSAFTASWPNIRIEVATATSPGTGDWIELIPAYTPLVGASIANATLNGAVNANVSTIVVNVSTNITVGDILFLGDSSTANYELVEVKSTPSNTTIALKTNTQFAHANASIVTDQAEKMFIPLSLTEAAQIRARVDNLNSGQNIAAQVTLITFDSFA
jgi:ribosomal protein S16